MHVPMFLKDKDRKTSGKFIKDTKADILAVIELLYSRGMWSKYHYEKWTEEIKNSMDEVSLHGFWDSIVNGAMFEEDAEEVYEMQNGLAKKMVEDGE